MIPTHGDQTDGTLNAGVIGVGSMGRNHARVYRELQLVDLVGVSDVDPDVAASVAERYETTPYRMDDLLEAVDIVSVAVPTPAHYETVSACIDAGVHVLIEKPFVDDVEQGRDLALRARDADVTIQVGHIERFNPVIETLRGIVPELDIISLEASRLGPPVDRGHDDSAVMDLMIHDLDIILALVDADLDSVSAVGAEGNRYASAICRFDDGVVATLTASRVTQRKTRQLSITAQDCCVAIDYTDQSVEIHRRSTPTYIESNGDLRLRNESVVEHPIVENGEPLKRELESFVRAVIDGTEPVVTAEDGLRIVAIASQIDDLATPRTTPEVQRR